MIAASAFTRVETERLVLRRPRLGDAAAVFAIQGDPRTHPFGSTPDASETESRARVEEWLAHWDLHGFGYWVVETRTASAVIGIGGLRLRELDTVGTVLNLYYRFAPETWGRGYATELARAAVRGAAERLAAVPVVAIINAANRASIRVAQAAGLIWSRRILYEGRERELYVAQT